MRLWGAAGETKAKLHMMSASALGPWPAASSKSWVSQRHHCPINTHSRDPIIPHLNFFPQASRTLGATLLPSLFPPQSLPFQTSLGAPPSPPHPFSIRPVPLYPVRLCNSPSNPQPCLSSPGGHLSLQPPAAHSSADPTSESQPSHITRRKKKLPFPVLPQFTLLYGERLRSKQSSPSLRNKTVQPKTPWRRGNGNTPSRNNAIFFFLSDKYCR